MHGSLSAARSLARDDDAAAAVAALREIDASGHVLTGWLPHAHLMYGLAFEQLAEPDSAIAHLELVLHPGSITESDSWGFARMQLPFVMQRLAELEEARGNTEAAIEHYRLFLELWSDPDPELRDQVASAERALARLVGSKTSP
jgi:tetratricopeptide (TPR) repeat protein